MKLEGVPGRIDKSQNEVHEDQINMWGVPPKLFYTLRFAGPPWLPVGSSLGSLELPQTSERFPKGL